MSTVKDDDGQHNGVNGSHLDHMEFNNESEGDSDGDAGPAPDAGSGNEAQEAENREKKFKFQIVESNLADEEVIRQLRESEGTLTGRAAALRKFFKFKTEDKVVFGVPKPFAVNSDENRRIFFETMFGEGPTRPHIDLFRGRFVDWKGDLVDERYSMHPMVQAMEIAGLTKQSLDPVRKSFKEYIMLRQKNDLIESFEKRIPEWDGVTRLETRLIDLFECFDTETTRIVGKYFWLSLYNRIVNPGCLAPIVLSLFGAQHAGKSRFSDSICQIVLDRPKAQAVQLDLAADKNDFLREITGQAVVANIGEMTGFTRGDLNKIKAFITKGSDIMHYKYEGQFEQQRQWVSILDGNKYEGLQRDASGNRRFYPLFVGQLPDEDGQPQWKEKFQCDWTDFEPLFWQMMAESRAWILANGEVEYNQMVNRASKAVFAFNENEMNNDRGTIKDDDLDTFLRPALAICAMFEIEGYKYNGVVVKISELRNRMAEVSRNRANWNDRHVGPKMAVLGAIKRQIRGDQSFLFENYKTPKELREFLANGGDTEHKVKDWVSPKGNGRDDVGGGF